MAKRRKALLRLAHAIDDNMGATIIVEDAEEYLCAQAILDLLYQNRFITGVGIIPLIERGQ